MKEFIIGLLGVGIGAILLFLGYKFARIIIPIWAFFAGFSIGAAGIADAMNSTFIGTTLGIVVGLIVGLVFALFSYFFYSLAVVLLGATTGYWVGVSLLALVGIDKGFLSATVGIVLGVIFALLTLGLNVAKYLLIVLTAIAGSTAIVTSVLVMFGQIGSNALNYAGAQHIIDNSVIWSIALFGLFIMGVIIQIITNKTYVIDSWTTQYGAPKTVKTYTKE